MLLRDNPERKQTAATVVLEDWARGEVRALFATMEGLGLLRVNVEFTDDGHHCNCEVCHLDGPEITVDAVQLVYDTGKRDSFGDDAVAADTGCLCFQNLPVDLDVDYLTDLLCTFDTAVGFGWMEFDARSQMVHGGRVLASDAGAYVPVHDWTCDIRDSDDNGTRLWD